jgi:hypothetical protein
VLSTTTFRVKFPDALLLLRANEPTEDLAVVWM